jgi:hypothetical protein
MPDCLTLPKHKLTSSAKAMDNRLWTEEAHWDARCRAWCNASNLAQNLEKAKNLEGKYFPPD